MGAREILILSSCVQINISLVLIISVNYTVQANEQSMQSDCRLQRPGLAEQHKKITWY